MPTYDYRCPANNRVVEVTHRMSETISTWGELCARAGIEPGDTPANTPVERLATGGNIISSNHLGSGCAPASSCPTGTCCAGGMCGLD
ncbi:zinc ribbon domain-containing protein [Caldichromatium japonicum]|uniref:Zinc ribbon domain-containing protein n=1 Tax=Caldichromatium japonicum TaxID=2699430 RepID=A0A6G7VFU3_9GAMM|nr:zinc ribbon domain-containing protein [Caldichromatium japonicum]QIK38746.1 zinc ribbon domain-containing protein [Caldichromatium japonicum]